MRIARQWWVPSDERAETSSILRRDLGQLFAGPLAAWLDGAAEVVAVGPYDACALLRERVGERLGSEEAGRRLTFRVAERMAGTIGVLGVYGDEWYGNKRTAARRRAELRKVGIEFVSLSCPLVCGWRSARFFAQPATRGSRRSHRLPARRR